MPQTIQKLRAELATLYFYKKAWTWASVIAFVSILMLATSWHWIDALHEESVWWIVTILMGIISINWWMWTVKIIKHIISNKETELLLVNKISKELTVVRKELEKLRPGNQDIDKQ